MSDEFRFDWDRQNRTGVPEVVLAEGKTTQQIASILDQAGQRHQSLLITRLSVEVARALEQESGASLDYDELSRTAFAGTVQQVKCRFSVGIVAAGTSDLNIAREAQRSLEFFGIQGDLYADVGVAGLWRIMSVADDLRAYPVLIAVAGMEGALFGVIAGLVPGIVIAVPTSVGYGVAAGGRAALSSALASCAPGLVTVNIDNGFGAAAAARKILSMHGPESAPGQGR